MRRKSHPLVGGLSPYVYAAHPQEKIGLVCIFIGRMFAVGARCLSVWISLSSPVAMVTDMVVLFRPAPLQASLTFCSCMGRAVVCVSAWWDSPPTTKPLQHEHKYLIKVNQAENLLWFTSYMAYYECSSATHSGFNTAWDCGGRMEDICHSNMVLSGQHSAQEGKEDVTVALPHAR